MGKKLVGTLTFGKFGADKLPVREFVKAQSGILVAVVGVHVLLLIVPVIPVVQPSGVKVTVVPLGTLELAKGILGIGEPTVPVIGFAVVAIGLPILRIVKVPALTGFPVDPATEALTQVPAAGLAKVGVIVQLAVF